MGFFSSVGSFFTNPVINAAQAVAGVIGQNATNNANRDIANQTNMTQEQIAQQNVQFQKEFAKNGIQWKVDDAAKAGISPLAALGAVDPGFSPTTFIPSSPAYQSPYTSLSSGLRDMGQSLDRSIANIETPEDRIIKANNLRTSTANADYAETQAANAKWELKHKQATPPNPASPGTGHAFKQIKNADGSIDIVPSDEAMSYLSHTIPMSPERLTWYLSNKLIPSIKDIYNNMSWSEYLEPWRR